MKKVSVVIVTWNVANYIRACLTSLINSKQVELEIFIVDNNSTDSTIETIQRWHKEYPQTNLTLIQNEKNFGFAAANNKGMKRASGEYILLLNPDTEVTPEALEKMIIFFGGHPQCAVAGCHLQNTDGTTQKSVRRFPTLASQILILLKLHHLFPRLSPLNRYGAVDFDYARTQIVDQVMGAFFMLPKKSLKTIGFLDEQFFIWFEEVDYCKRAYVAGQEVWYVSEANCIHHGGRSFVQELKLTNQKRFNTTMRQYFKKHHGALSSFVLSCFNPFSLGLATLKGLFHRHE